METTITMPAYVKATAILLGLVTFFFILWIGQDIITPLVFATILAIVLNPIVNMFSAKGLNRVVAIAIAITLAMALLAGLIWFISAQVVHFSDSFPALKERSKGLYEEAVRWAADLTNMKRSAIREWVSKAQSQATKNGSMLVGSTLTTIGGVFAFVFLLPVYIFLILFYKPLLLEFIAKLFPRKRHAMVADVLVLRVRDDDEPPVRASPRRG